MDKVSYLKKAHTLLVSMLIASLVLLPALYFSAVADDIFDEPREYLIVLFGGLAILLIEARRVLEGHALFSGGSGTWPRRLLFLFVGWAALSAALAVNSAVGWAYWATVASFALIGISILGWLEASLTRRDIIWGALATLVMTQVIVVAAQFARLPLVEWATHMPALKFGEHVLPGGFALYDLLFGAGMSGANGSSVGTFGNLNYLGEFLCLTLPVLIGWAAGASMRRIRWAVGLLSVMGCGALLLTGARGALLGFLVVAPIAAVTIWGVQALNPLHHWQTPQRRLFIGLGVIVGVGMFATLGGLATVKFQALTRGDGGIQARLVNWRSDFGLVAERPLAGAGVGNYKVVHQDKLRADHPTGIAGVVSDGRFLRAHNEPLQVMIEFGLVGFALVGAMLVAWWRAVRRNDEMPPAMRFGVLWGVGALLISGCFGFPLHIPVTAVALVLVGATGLARAREIAEPERVVTAWRWAYATLAICLLAGVLLLLVQRVYLPQYQAHQFLFAGRALHVNNREPQALVVYGLVDRTVRFKGVYRIEYLRSLVMTGRYDEAIRLMDASGREGLGFEAAYWKARALWGVGRIAEAQGIYEEVKAYFSPTHRWGIAAMKDLEAIKRGEKPALRKG